jgi:hypothetical protein
MARVTAGTDGGFNFNFTGGDPDWNAFAHVMAEFGRAMGEWGRQFSAEQEVLAAQ